MISANRSAGTNVAKIATITKVRLTDTLLRSELLKRPEITRDSIGRRLRQSGRTRKFTPIVQRPSNIGQQLPRTTNSKTIGFLHQIVMGNIAELSIHAHQMLIGPFTPGIVGMRHVIGRSQPPVLAFY